MRVVKRHKNRRLYDTATSRTITQTELAAIVRTGSDIKVVDSATGNDITLAVLGRVMLSEASRWEDIRESKELFRKVISLGGDKSMSVLKNTILASIGAIQVTKAKAEKIIDELIQKGELNRSDRKKAVMELLEKTEKSTVQLKEKISRGAGRTQEEIGKLVRSLNVAKQSDLKSLEAKVDKLTKALKNLEKKLDQMNK
ncbi:MAG: phasin family protein [Candidatus Zixiibacteriota bacterium]|nr:MAG: phasin family protein [candidate division Zixibacteria bacterium]